MSSTNGTVKKGNPLDREVRLPANAIALLRSMGIQLPSEIMEIETPVISSDETRQIILPTGMDKLTASEELKKQYKNEEEVIAHSVNFDGWDWKDALIAIKVVTEDTFGWMNSKPSWRKQPTEIDVVVDIKKGKKLSEKAYYGMFSVTTWDDATCDIQVQRDGSVSMDVQAKRKYASEVTAYFNLIRTQLETKSIYRGRNIVVTGGSFGVDFEIIENKGSDKIILNQDEQLVVDNFVIDSLDELNKRCYLFTGPYGNGKTETAMKVGRIGVEKHNMSFFYLKDAKLFDRMLNLSKKYQPCILFMEDIDEIASGENRDAEMNRILNTLDGVQTKGNALTTIFTTNHANRINPALRRPGRIDLIIRFDNPNKESIRKIFTSYLEEFDGFDTLDWDAITAKVPDVQGAVIAEICKRTVKLIKTHNNKVTTDIVLATIASMAYQIELMAEKVEGADKDKIFVEKFQDMIQSAVWNSQRGDHVYNEV